jgi:hypothetical protein
MKAARGNAVQRAARARVEAYRRAHRIWSRAPAEPPDGDHAAMDPDDNGEQNAAESTEKEAHR